MLRTLTRVEGLTAGLGTAGALLALAGWGPDLAIGVAAGAAVALANFWALRRLMAAMILSDSGVAQRGLMAVLGGLKLLALIAVVGLLVSTLRVDAWGFFLGTLCLAVAIPAAVVGHTGAPRHDVA